MDVAGVAAVAQRINDEAKMRMTIHVKTVSRKYVIFSFGGELFSPTGGIKHIFGCTFKFEHEGIRAELGSWLDMIGAKNGDSLLHLALRLSGCENVDKVCQPSQLFALSIASLNALDIAWVIFPPSNAMPASPLAAASACCRAIGPRLRL